MCPVAFLILDTEAFKTTGQDISCTIENIDLMLLLSCYVTSVVSTLCDPIDSSPPGSPVPGFSRQEHWSGLPFPSPMHECESEVTQLYPTLSNPMDCSLPGFSVHGILQARNLEQVAISSSMGSLQLRDQMIQ